MAKFRSKFTFEPGGIFSRMALPKAFQKRQSETRFKQEWNVPLGKYGMAKYQRGSISMMAGGGTMGAGVTGSVVLTGETNIKFDGAGGTVNSGFVFNSDGSIDELGILISTLVQVDPGEWWSNEPDVGIGSSYDIRATASGGWDVAAAANNTWIDLSADRTWRVIVLLKNSPDISSASDTFEISLTGNATAIDSAFYYAEASNGL